MAVAALSGCRPASGPVLETVWIVDAGFAFQYRHVLEAMSQAGASVRAFDFPGATLANGNRYAWARDYGPLPVSRDTRDPRIWDAVNAGSASHELDHQALAALARHLGVSHSPLDLVLQGGNWLPLLDGRAITTPRLFDDNRALSRQQIAATVRHLDVREIIEISPLPGELTRHADMVVAVHPLSNDVFVGEVWSSAIDLVPRDDGWKMYRDLTIAMQSSLDSTAEQLRSVLGTERVHRFPQPLPHLDRHPEEERYRPTFPSFVNGIFIVADDDAVTYLYGLSGDPHGRHLYSFDVGLVDEYTAEVARVGRLRGFATVGVDTGSLIRNGGSLHCATIELLAPAGSRAVHPSPAVPSMEPDGELPLRATRSQEKTS